jgi:signal peptidase I
MNVQEAGAGELLANLSIGTIVLAAFILTCLRLVMVPNRTPVARSVAELTESLILAGVLVFLVIRPFLLQAFFIPTESMEPSLMGHDVGRSSSGAPYTDSVHDHLFVNKLAYRLGSPKRGDIAVFRAPKDADIEGGYRRENILVKRVIGIPGDAIQIKEADDDTMKVWRNGRMLDEPYIQEPMYGSQQSGAKFGVNGPITLRDGQYFVMGDNRNRSWDSRFWGVVTRDRIIGKVSFIFWPFSRIGFIR